MLTIKITCLIIAALCLGVAYFTHKSQKTYLVLSAPRRRHF